MTGFTVSRFTMVKAHWNEEPPVALGGHCLVDPIPAVLPGTGVGVWAETWERNARGKTTASSHLFIEHASLFSGETLAHPWDEKARPFFRIGI
jgi:hypothetical protein